MSDQQITHFRRPVDSSSLASVGFDPESQVLEVEFRHGGVYRYYGVPSTVYQELMIAPSKGRFFVAHLRNSYRCLRMGDGVVIGKAP